MGRRRERRKVIISCAPPDHVAPLGLNPLKRKSCSEGSGVVYLVGNDSKTSLLAPSSLPGDACFDFVFESRGGSPSGRGTEDPGLVVRRILRAGDCEVRGGPSSKVISDQ